MPKIRSIAIKNFRSIQDLELETTDLTVMVGDNDSGKSNILRALNLFFNDFTDYGHPLDFDRDFNRFVTLNRQAPEIKIELTLEIPEAYRSNNGDFVRWTKTWRRDSLRNTAKVIGLRREPTKRGRDRLVEVELSSRSKVPSLLSHVEFEYIPAIRSSDFFRVLRGRIYRAISEATMLGFSDQISVFEQAIGTHVKGLTTDILQEINDHASLRLPPDLSEFFESLDFLSSDSISLNARGDGVKGRYIPLILKFIASTKQALQTHGAQPHTFIWAYEEPENNLEFRRAQELSDLFVRMSREQSIQILMTTHSPIFFNVGQHNDPLRSARFISRLSNESGTKAQAELGSMETLDTRMGVMTIVAPYVQRAENEVTALRDEASQLREELSKHNTQNLPTIFVEGESDYIVFQAALKLLFPDFSARAFIFHPPRRAGADFVINMLRAWEARTKFLNLVDRVQAIGILDGDTEGKDAVKRFEKELKGSRYISARTLACPPHLQGAMRSGFSVSATLEEHYPLESWQHAQAMGWLQKREPADALSENYKNKLVNGETTWKDMLGDAPWEIVVSYRPTNDSKVLWAKDVARKLKAGTIGDLGGLPGFLTECVKKLHRETASSTADA